MLESRQQLLRFMQDRWIPNEKALAAWIMKVGVSKASADLRMPSKALSRILEKQYPNGAQFTCQPKNYSFGLAIEQSETTPKKQSCSAGLSINELGPRLNANLPEEHLINVPVIDETTDQGSIGSCVSWAGAHVMDNAIANADGDPSSKANPSAIYGFIKGHGLDPWPNEHGSTLEALNQALLEFGAPNWDSMPVYRTAPEGNPANLPPPDHIEAAAAENHIEPSYWIQEWTADSLNAAQCLMYGAHDGPENRQLAICTAFYVPSSFFNNYTAETGIVLMPPSGDDIIGGHAVVFIGWKQIDGRTYFVVKNSWGTDFGDKGYLYFPLDFITEYFKESFVIPGLAREEVEEDLAEAQPAALANGFTYLSAGILLTLVIMVGLKLTQPMLSGVLHAESPLVEIAHHDLQMLSIDPPENRRNSANGTQPNEPIVRHLREDNQVMAIYTEILEMIHEQN